MLNREEQILAKWLQDSGSFRSIGMTDNHILEEIERMRQCRFESDYLRINRAGSTLQLSRKGRQSIWMLFEKAVRHAKNELDAFDLLFDSPQLDLFEGVL